VPCQPRRTTHAAGRRLTCRISDSSSTTEITERTPPDDPGRFTYPVKQGPASGSIKKMSSSPLSPTGYNGGKTHELPTKHVQRKVTGVREVIRGMREGLSYASGQLCCCDGAEPHYGRWFNIPRRDICWRYALHTPTRYHGLNGIPHLGIDQTASDNASYHICYRHQDQIKITTSDLLKRDGWCPPFFCCRGNGRPPRLSPCTHRWKFV
jgi:hypothetical protein